MIALACGVGVFAFQNAEFRFQFPISGLGYDAGVALLVSTRLGLQPAHSFLLECGNVFPGIGVDPVQLPLCHSSIRFSAVL